MDDIVKAIAEYIRFKVIDDEPQKIALNLILIDSADRALLQQFCTIGRDGLIDRIDDPLLVMNHVDQGL